MRDHVISVAEVINEGNCRVMCYMEPNCVSINFGPSHGGKYRCELNNATDEDHMTVLEEKPTFTFLAIEVTFYRSIYSWLIFIGLAMFSHCSYRVLRHCGFPLSYFKVKAEIFEPCKHFNHLISSI